MRALFGKRKEETKHRPCCVALTIYVFFEIHFLIECQAYKDLRHEFLQPIKDKKPNSTYYTNLQTFLYLLSEEFTPVTTTFIHKCFSVGEFLIANHRNEI